MAFSTVAEYLQELRALQLVNPEQWDELSRTAAIRFRNVSELSNFLLQRRLLTQYQIDQMQTGRGKRLVAGAYQILDCLGAGGTSEVFRALDVKNGQVVALKVVNSQLLKDPEIVGRFKRETRVLRALSHPNIVRYLDSGTFVDGIEQVENLYLAMEFVQGTDLRQMVMAGPLQIPQACNYIQQAAHGLQHAHEHGVVHRDIKPGNLFLTVPQRVIKVVDLGLARPQNPLAAVSTGSIRNVTVKGGMVGTADYLAPEQAKDSTTVDPRADIYSLGCTLYHFLAGRPPFADAMVMAKLVMHQKQEPRPVESLRGQIPLELAATVRRMMAKKADDRYQTAAAVAEALQPFCQAAPA
jgi:serine/threonine-protein kinase